MFCGYFSFALFVFAIECAGMRKIFNGFKAKISDYPFLVKILILTKTTTGHCTGTYIDPYWVLTAAHCVEDIPSHTIIHCCMGGELAALYNCIHLRYATKVITPKTLDVGMVKLDKPFPLGPHVQLAPLPETRIALQELIKQPCFAAGWGRTEKNLISKHLLASKVSLLDICATTENFCVLGDLSGPCKGDSGSPLICNGTVIGVLSSGTSAICGETYVLYFYARTDVGKNFIYDAISGKLSQNRASKFYIIAVYLILYWSGIY